MAEAIGNALQNRPIDVPTCMTERKTKDHAPGQRIVERRLLTRKVGKKDQLVSPWREYGCFCVKLIKAGPWGKSSDETT